jgi:hypothetical protein
MDIVFPGVACLNANGVASSSPRLFALADYLGLTVGRRQHNPKGVAAARVTRYNPLGVENKKMHPVSPG